MTNLEDTWRDRHGLVEYAYGPHVIHMLTIQMVAYHAYRQLDLEDQEKVEKLIKDYQRKNSKEKIASIVDAICDLLNPNNEITLLNGVLDSCCFYNSLYNDFGLKHVFSVIFLPLLVSSVTWQKKFFFSTHSLMDEIMDSKSYSLYEFLIIHRDILKWHNTGGETEVNPLFDFGELFVKKATLGTRYSNDLNGKLKSYFEIQVKFGRAWS